jgi:NADPH:quinone reductase-like Zn-dependent oxidoreductase
VLVQVQAVSLDKFDSDMVKEKATSGSGSGKWIPGRSFVGRAVNVGTEVRVISKGDIVMGLVDIRKVSDSLGWRETSSWQRNPQSGCLAEYIVCERKRLARIPLGVNLSLEEVACLPLLGVTAHRACVGQTRGSRALILNAHEGVGALAAQELSSMGLHVIAHVPLDVANAEDDAWENGAKEVIADDPVAMINAQHESGFEFVLDTIGGRRIYDACRRVLRSNGV